MIRKKDVEKYATGKWNGRPNYECPQHPHYKTIDYKSFIGHLQSHVVKKKGKNSMGPNSNVSVNKNNKKNKGGKK